MEYTIRHIHKKDREAVEKICIATGPAQAEATEDMRKLLLTVFCHYYQVPVTAPRLLYLS